MKIYNYKKILSALLVGVMLGGFGSLAKADGIPPVVGSDATSASDQSIIPPIVVTLPSIPPTVSQNNSSSTSMAPLVLGSDSTDSSSTIPVVIGSNDSSTTSIIPPVLSSDSTGDDQPMPQTSTLVVTVTGGSNLNNVTSVGGVIDCNSSSLLCSTSATTGTTITLTANTYSNNIFLGWSGACINTDPTCVVTLASNTEVAANFTTPVIVTGPVQTTTQSTVLSSGNGAPAGEDFSFYPSSSAQNTALSANISPAVPPTASTGIASPVELSAVCDLLTTPLHIGQANDPASVSTLQALLNKLEGADLSVNGIFDQATFNAVNNFQAKYTNNILVPWGTTTPSGYVYITTLKELNQLNCNSTTPLTQVDLATIAAYKAGVALGNQTGSANVAINTSASSTSGISGQSTIPTTISPGTNVSGASSTTPIEVGAVETTTNSNIAAVAGSEVGNFFGSIANFFSTVFHKIF